MKRSTQVGLFLAGTMAVGGTAYLAMPRENCDPARPGFTVTGASAWTVACSQRQTSSSSSGGGGGSRYGLFSGGSSDNGSTSTSRGGFGSFGHAFSGGG